MPSLFCVSFLISFFIKNIVAVAAYIRLTSRSQTKFQNKRNWVHSGFRAQPHLRRARHPPICHLNSRLACLRMWIWHALSQWPSQAFSKLDTKLVCGCLPRSPVGRRSGRFWHRFGSEFDFIPTCVNSHSLLTTRQDGGVTWSVVVHGATAKVFWLLSI